MDDLVKRLRERGQRADEMPNHYVRRMEIDRIEAAAALEAKDAEIAALRAEVARLQEALSLYAYDWIITVHNGQKAGRAPGGYLLRDQGEIARAALQRKD